MSWTVHAFGSNSSGKLGIGHEEDVSTPTQCLWHGGIPASKPRNLASGGNHSIILFGDGSAWVSGENGNGRCGVEPEGGTRSKFQQVGYPDGKGGEIHHFSFVSATWEASTFVSAESGSLYTCGTGSKGELGLGDGTTDCPTPQKIKDFPPSDTRIVDIAACMSHTLVVLSNGEAYGWGAGRKGQLGEPSVTVWKPRKIGGIEFPVARAACGRDFTYLTAPPARRSHIVLGADRCGVKSQAPLPAPCWKEIAASWGTLYILANDGRVCSWGRNDHGQIPSSEMPLLENLVVGSEHVLAKDRDGSVVAWGWGEHGNCGVPVLGSGIVKDPRNMIQEPKNSSLLGAGCATSFLAAGTSQVE